MHALTGGQASVPDLEDVAALFAKMEKTIRRLAGLALDDPAVAVQLAGFTGRWSRVAAHNLHGWVETYGDIACESIGVECGGDDCGFHTHGYSIL